MIVCRFIQTSCSMLWCQWIIVKIRALFWQWMYSNEDSLWRLFESMEEMLRLIYSLIGLDCVYACESIHWISLSSWKLSYDTNTETRKRYGLSIFFMWFICGWSNVRDENWRKFSEQNLWILEMKSIDLIWNKVNISNHFQANQRKKMS